MMPGARPLPMRRSICIALHDVAPATWPKCATLLRAVAQVAPDAPLTLLVVPRWHASDADAPPASARDDRPWVDAILTREARGDELALHGYTHRDNAPTARWRPLSRHPIRATFDAAVDHVRRRVLTDREGEFSALDARAAAARIARARAWARDIGWHPQGFVAPAWALSRGTWQTLRASDFLYTTTVDALIRLDRGIRVAAPCVTASARTAPRRLASLAWVNMAEHLFASAPLLRLGLHPNDADMPRLVRAWQALIERALCERDPLTKVQAIARYAPNVAPIDTTLPATAAPIARPATTSLG